MSLIGDAFAGWRECRSEYDETLYTQYVAAEEATRGAMLNARGRAKGIGPISLFLGNETRALAHASRSSSSTGTRTRGSRARCSRSSGSAPACPSSSGMPRECSDGDRAGRARGQGVAARPRRHLERLCVVDMIHESKTACRLCGQIVNRLDAFGLCSKTTELHRQRRGDITPAKKARKR